MTLQLKMTDKPFGIGYQYWPVMPLRPPLTIALDGAGRHTLTNGTPNGSLYATPWPTVDWTFEVFTWSQSPLVDVRIQSVERWSKAGSLLEAAAGFPTAYQTLSLLFNIYSFGPFSIPWTVGDPDDTIIVALRFNGTPTETAVFQHWIDTPLDIFQASCQVLAGSGPVWSSEPAPDAVVSFIEDAGCPALTPTELAGTLALHPTEPAGTAPVIKEC